MNYTRRSINNSIEQAAIGSGTSVFVASIYGTLFLENRACAIDLEFFRSFVDFTSCESPHPPLS
jgi:hypothetical protein